MFFGGGGTGVFSVVMTASSWTHAGSTKRLATTNLTMGPHADKASLSDDCNKEEQHNDSTPMNSTRMIHPGVDASGARIALTLLDSRGRPNARLLPVSSIP